jgi:hypothetical protein
MYNTTLLHAKKKIKKTQVAVIVSVFLSFMWELSYSSSLAPHFGKIEIAIAPHSSLLYFHSLFFLCLCMAIRHGHCDIIPPNASQLADGLSKPGSWRKLCHNGYTAQGLMTKNSIISILWAFSRGNHRQTICHTQFAHVHVCLGPGISSEIFTSKKRQDRMEP